MEAIIDNTTQFTALTSAGSFYKWFSMSLSADGSKIIAARNFGHIYLSIDYGQTWTQLTAAGAHYWATIYITPDGKTMYATPNDKTLYRSADGGVTWTSVNIGSTVNSYSITSSFDGSIVYVGSTLSEETNGYIYKSTDSGETWKQLTAAGQRKWTGIDTTYDGSIVYAVDHSSSTGGVYKSTDSGETWTNTSPIAGIFMRIRCSFEGDHVICGYADKFFWSTDGGDTWNHLTGIETTNWYWASVISDNGQIMAAACRGGYIYITINGGASWVKYAASGNKEWFDLCISQNGKYLYAMTINEYIYYATAEMIKIEEFIPQIHIY